MTQIKFIDSSKISVILQGPINNFNITKSLFQIKRILPKAEIIVSTWKNQKKIKFTNVKFVYLQEPRGFTDINGVQLNYNKMIYSTYAGIKMSNKPYILKLRTDCLIKNKNFLKIYKSSNIFNKKIFKEKINITNFFTRNPAKLPYLFFLSDLVMFGLKSEMIKIWHHKYLKQKNDFFYTKSNFLNIFNNYNGYSILKKNPEQMLFINMKKKFGFKNDLASPCQLNFKFMHESETLLISNFHLFDSNLSGIIFPNKFYKNSTARSLIYSTKDFVKLNKIYQNPTKIYLRYTYLIFNKYILNFFKSIFYRSNFSIFYKKYLKS